jgi:hypothetical protein
MKIVIAILALSIVALAGPVSADPWAVSASYPATAVQPTFFDLYFDGAATPVKVLPTTDSGGLKYLLYDVALAGLANGSHTAQAEAGNDAGVSGKTASVPFPLPFIEPSSPSSFGVVKTKPIR